jgi:hypothetical protein
MNKYELKVQLRNFKKRNPRFYFAYRHAVTGEAVLLKGPSLEYVQDMAEHYRKKALAADVVVLEDSFNGVGGNVKPRDMNAVAMAALKQLRPAWFATEGKANG